MRQAPACSLCKRSFEGQGFGDGRGDGALSRCEALLVALQHSGARSDKPPHLFWNAEIADAHLPEHRLHVGAELIHELLRQIVGFCSPRLEAMEDSEQVERQEDEASLKRVRDAKRLIENRKPRLRHNRAIEFL